MIFRNKKISDTLAGKKKTTSVKDGEGRFGLGFTGDEESYGDVLKVYYEDAISMNNGSKKVSKDEVEKTITLDNSGVRESDHCPQCFARFKIACIPCSHKVCMNCSFLKKHRHHTVIEIEELENIYKKRNLEISKLTKKLTRKIQVCNPRTKVAEELGNKIDMVESSIESYCGILKGQIEKWRQRSLKEARDYKEKIENLIKDESIQGPGLISLKKLNSKWKKDLFDLKHNSEMKKNITLDQIFASIPQEFKDKAEDSKDFERMLEGELKFAEDQLVLLDMQESRIKEFLVSYLDKNFTQKPCFNELVSFMRSLPSFYSFPDVQTLGQNIISILKRTSQIPNGQNYGKNERVEVSSDDGDNFLTDNFGSKNIFEGISIEVDSSNKENNYNCGDSDDEDIQISPIDKNYRQDGNESLESICKSITPTPKKKNREDQSQEESNIFLSEFKQPLSEFKIQQPNYDYKDRKESAAIQRRHRRKSPFQGPHQRLNRISGRNNPMGHSLNFSQRSDRSINRLTNLRRSTCITPNGTKSPNVFKIPERSPMMTTNRNRGPLTPSKQASTPVSAKSQINLKMGQNALRLLKAAKHRSVKQKVKDLITKIRGFNSHINLRKSKIDDKTLAFLFHTFKELQNGITIDLSHNKITDTGFDLLIHSLKMKHVESINLSSNRIQGSLLKKLNHLMKKTSMLKITKEINLKDNPIELDTIPVSLEKLSHKISI